MMSPRQHSPWIQKINIRTSLSLSLYFIPSLSSDPSLPLSLFLAFTLCFPLSLPLFLSLSPNIMLEFFRMSEIPLSFLDWGKKGLSFFLLFLQKNSETTLYINIIPSRAPLKDIKCFKNEYLVEKP